MNTLPLGQGTALSVDRTAPSKDYYRNDVDSFGGQIELQLDTDTPRSAPQ